MSLNNFYKESKYKMTPLYFCRWIGKMIMKFLPECNFVNLSENIQTMPNFRIDKIHVKYFVQILHMCASSLSFLESFCWYFSECPAATPNSRYQWISLQIPPLPKILDIFKGGDLYKIPIRAAPAAGFSRRWILLSILP